MTVSYTGTVDLDAALPGRLRRGRCACPPPPLAPRAYRGFRPHRRPLRVCRTRLHFADRLRAGAGRRSGSGRRQGRVCWGRPLLSRPREAVGFGLAAVESAAASVVALTSDVRGVCCWWVWLVVRFVCVPLCVRVFSVSRVCPGSPRCLFTGRSVCVPAPPVSFYRSRLPPVSFYR